MTVHSSLHRLAFRRPSLNYLVWLRFGDFHPCMRCFAKCSIHGVQPMPNIYQCTWRFCLLLFHPSSISYIICCFGVTLLDTRNGKTTWWIIHMLFFVTTLMHKHTNTYKILIRESGIGHIRIVIVLLLCGVWRFAVSNWLFLYMLCHNDM